MFKFEKVGKGRPSIKDMDLAALDELIGSCEGAMVRPFEKKKTAIAIEVKPESEPEADQEAEEAADDEAAPDLSDVDVEELLRMYQEMKEGKE